MTDGRISSQLIVVLSEEELTPKLFDRHTSYAAFTHFPPCDCILHSLNSSFEELGAAVWAATEADQ